MIDRPKMLNERQETRAGKIFSALCTFAVLLLVAFTVFNLWFVNAYFVVEVEGESMENTLQSGDFLYAERVNFVAERGDVVIIDVKGHSGLFEPKTADRARRRLRQMRKGRRFAQKSGRRGFYAARRALCERRYARFCGDKSARGADLFPRR